MRLGLGTGSGVVYELLTEAGRTVHEVAEAVDRRIANWPSGPTQDEVKELEHRTDHLISELLGHANSLFVTPFDRDDLIVLAFAVDDVADAAENASELFGLYGVEAPTKQAIQLSGLLVRAAELLAKLLAGLKGMRGSSEEIRLIKEIEDEADDVARAARASLFKDDRIDPMIVIRWKDIYEALEEAVDACETAAHRVGNILVKNA
jgi:predicted phosphate transport protein (TIGR00153 family)